MRSVIIALCLCLVLSLNVYGMQKEDPGNPVCVIETSMGKIYLELFIKEAPETVKNFIDLAEGKKEFTKPGTKEKIRKPFYDNLIFHRVIKDFMIQGGCPVGNGTEGPGYRFKDEINASALGLDRIKVMQSNIAVHDYVKQIIRSQDDFARLVAMPLAKKMGVSSQEEFIKKEAEIKKKLPQVTLKDFYEFMGYRYDDKLNSHGPFRGVIAMANSGPNTNGSQFFINLIDTPWLKGKHTVFGKVILGMEVVDKIGAVEVGRQSKPVKDVRIISIRKHKK